MDDEQVEELAGTLLVVVIILVTIFIGSLVYDWYSYHSSSELNKQVTKTYYKVGEK